MVKLVGNNFYYFIFFYHYAKYLFYPLSLWLYILAINRLKIMQPNALPKQQDIGAHQRGTDVMNHYLRDFTIWEKICFQKVNLIYIYIFYRSQKSTHNIYLRYLILKSWVCIFCGKVFFKIKRVSCVFLFYITIRPKYKLVSLNWYFFQNS